MKTLKICVLKYKLDPAKKISVPGFALQLGLEKTKVKLDLLTDIDMLLMVEKGIREGICPAFVDMQKLITNT